MIDSSYFLDCAALGVSATLGAALLVCGTLLVVKMAGSLASTSNARADGEAHSAGRRPRSVDVYASIYRALLDAKSAELATVEPLLAAHQAEDGDREATAAGDMHAAVAE